MHEPNKLWPWVFRQHQIWVDIHGTEHEIESMPLDYIGNVINFCRIRAERIRTIAYVDWLARAVELALNGAAVEEARETLEPEPDLLATAEEWLASTPLMLALKRRVEA
jgi:hypothetical protein